MLTDAKIRAAEPGRGPTSCLTGRACICLIKPNGARLWRFKYRYGGKEKLMAFGGYQPGSSNHVPLAEARDRLADAKRQLRGGIDPSAAKKAEKMARTDREAGVFEVVALEWHGKQSPTWSADYAAKELRQLRKHVIPRVGGKPFRELTSRDLLDVLQRI
jgi:hypothetical protein